MSHSEQYYSNVVPMTDSADLFVRIGWCPDVVKITNLNTGRGILWNRIEHGHTAGAAKTGGLQFGTASTVGISYLATGGIALCTFTDESHLMSSDPATVDATNFPDANGIKIASSADCLASDVMLLVEAWRINFPILRGYHNGTTNCNTYFEDTSYDFRKLGVSGNGHWVVYNKSNGNYAYAGRITKGASGSNFCRIYTYTDRTLENATTAADFDTNDIVYVMPIEAMPYPLSDIGAMT